MQKILDWEYTKSLSVFEGSHVQSCPQKIGISLVIDVYRYYVKFINKDLLKHIL